MRAVGFFEFGGPDVLQLLDLPETQPGPGQVRVRVHAATVNPTDTLLRNGSRAQSLHDVAPPHVPGMDVAGVIDAIGPNTSTDLVLGDSVMAMVNNRGSHGDTVKALCCRSTQWPSPPKGFLWWKPPRCP